MKKYFLLFCLLFASAVFAQGWQDSYGETLAAAKKQDKTILLVFSGSDWCAPCIKLDKKVWRSDAFSAYARKNYVLYKADFPRKKKNRLPDAVVSRNRALAERYNPKGHFPLVLLLNTGGAVLGETGYLKGTPELYIEHLNSLIK
jgi:thioredoxin-related protein